MDFDELEDMLHSAFKRFLRNIMTVHILFFAALTALLVVAGSISDEDGF